MNKRRAYHRIVARTHWIVFRVALFACRPDALLLLTVLSVVAWALPARAAGPVAPDWQQYTVPFQDTFLPDGTGVQASPPTSGNDASDTTGRRARSILQYLACGQENRFLSLALNIGDPGTYDELMNIAMAKLAWLKAGFAGGPSVPGDCRGIFNVVHAKGDLSDFVGAFANLSPPVNTLQDFASLHQTTFNGDCVNHPESCACAQNQTPASFSLPQNLPPSVFLRIQAVVPQACLRAQINWVLSRIQKGDAQPGSNGLPCNIEYLVNLVELHALTQGDWDMRMKALVRILYLDRLGGGDPAIPAQLTEDVRNHILDDLLVVDGGPGRDSYSWMDCGDNEDNTGTPQQREDDNSSTDGFIDSVGDVFTWFLKRLVLFNDLAVTGGTGVAAALAGLPQLDGGLVAGLGLAATLFGQIPETENHRLMIESTRFLKNQLVIDALNGNAPNISSGQAGVKAWLLDRFHSIATGEFIEYNARPYASFSIEALRNLADFADDADVRTAAQMLIEYSAAKFAIGSNQGRRLPPYRRHFGVLDCLDGNPCQDEDAPNNNTAVEIFRGFTTGSGFGDAEVANGLLYNGQTQSLPFGRIPEETAGQLVPAATTQVFPISTPPPGMIADLAIRKSTPYVQQINHDVLETYSSSPVALITAGGIQTDHAYKFGPNPPAILVNNALDLFGKDLQDRGAALPTTVIFTDPAVDVTSQGSGARIALDHFIQFRGTSQDQGGEEGLNDNLCVWQDFACGTHLRIPSELNNCMGGPIQSHWFFFDSGEGECTYRNVVPEFYVAIYVICPNDDCGAPVNTLPDNNAGFLEVVDNPTMSFPDFINQVMKSNPLGIVNLGQGCLSGGDCQGHYTTTTDHQLFIALRGHQDDSNKTGVISVDGVAQKDLSQINFADGFTTLGSGIGAAPISSKGDGVITVVNPNTSETLVLDFSNPSHPCQSTSGGPCVQLPLAAAPRGRAP